MSEGGREGGRERELATPYALHQRERENEIKLPRIAQRASERERKSNFQCCQLLSGKILSSTVKKSEDSYRTILNIQRNRPKNPNTRKLGI